MISMPGADGEAATGSDSAAEIDGIVEAIVEVLAAEPLLEQSVSRHLLVARTGRRLGLPLQIPEIPLRRQWLLAFVAECAMTHNGLAAMTLTIGQLEGRGRVYRAVVDLVDRLGRARQVTDAPAPSAAELMGLTAAELSALAAVYSDPTAASQLLSRAGLPRYRHPWVGRNSEAFWTEVNWLVIIGAFPDGRARILREAAAEYPANPWMAAG
ncbi:conserved hypothetical protein [Frankia sp. AiPs1]|uniref:effector-associated domain EAD1-containing protein n=1 Tax=Frankia sp. AiPa1 TaxID=573492 RepID=UPI00202B1DA9|nr:effector-associated domain EAD1-containing protein [Frankia sp. AiPa1]MCL9758897.1 effector-associated domain EAD1-containing protein [Frankia sp. AiPa1]